MLLLFYSRDVVSPSRNIFVSYCLRLYAGYKASFPSRNGSMIPAPFFFASWFRSISILEQFLECLKGRDKVQTQIQICVSTSLTAQCFQLTFHLVMLVVRPLLILRGCAPLALSFLAKSVFGFRNLSLNSVDCTSQSSHSQST